MLNKIKYGITSTLRGLFQINEAKGSSIVINELLDFPANVAVNKVWMRGDSYELRQLYGQIADNRFSFWGSVPTAGLEIRKIHTGIPRTMVNILTSCIVDDLQNVTFDDANSAPMWEDIAEENHFRDLVKAAVSKTLVCGDGAFKISIDTAISKYPIMEFYEADRIEVKREHGRISEIIFATPYKVGYTKYILLEHYGRGYVHYELQTETGGAASVDSVPELVGLQDVSWSGNFMLAYYMAFYISDKYEGRGQSIFDAKRDNFDALDEAWSQWMDALRAGRTKTYIPENLLPRDPNTGEIMRGNSFDNRFIKMAAATSETDNGKIETVSPNIPHDSYLQTYVTALDLCLQGVISPSTLGIDTKKLDNAEAQREKEKATLYTRQTVVAVLQNVLPQLVQGVFYAAQTMAKQEAQEVGADIAFGEYANPSFESQVETVGKAKMQGVMSIRAAIEELYGDSKTEDWKDEEERRIMQEQGIMQTEEPAVNADTFISKSDTF